MLLTNDEIVGKLKKVFEINKAIKSLGEQRHAEEVVLSAEYKIDECNTKRAAIEAKYRPLLQAQRDIHATIQSDLGDE